MTDEVPALTAALRPVGAARRMVLAGYSRLGRGNRRLIGVLLKLALLLYFVFCALFLSLRYAILPNIDHYQGSVEQLVSRALGQPVSIGAIASSWHGLRPHLSLRDVVVRDAQGQPALRLPQVAATVSWWSLAVADLRLSDLEITRPQLEIRRSADGKLYVGGIYIDTTRRTGNGAADWLLAQREVLIRDGSVRWTDAQRQAPELTLRNVDFILHNRWQRHRAALRATPLPVTAGAGADTGIVDLRIDFTHPRFAPSSADPALWVGELYAALPDVDLARWQAYIDYPFELQRGRGSLRAWLQFDHASVAAFTTDVKLDGVAARLQPDLPVLALRHLQGRIFASEGVQRRGKTSWLQFGRHGHVLAFYGLGLQTEDGTVLPPATLRQSMIIGDQRQPSKSELVVQTLDLAPLAPLVAALPLSTAQRQVWQALAPRGRLRDFSLQWRGPWSDFSRYVVKGSFSELGLAHPDAGAAPDDAAPDDAAPAALFERWALPGFRNLTGSIDASERGGRLVLDARQPAFELRKRGTDPWLELTRLRLETRWDFPATEQLRVQLQRLELQSPDLEASFSGSHLRPLHQSGMHGSIDLSGRIAHFNIDQVGRYLPPGTPPHLRAWLQGALLGGQATDVKLALKGDLARFPFREGSARPSDERFTVSGKIRQGVLNYTPGEFGADGKAPEWPLLQQIDGSFHVERSRLEIHANSARSSRVAITNVHAVVPDLLAEHLQLAIDGSAAGALQDFVAFTNHSPVLGWIGGLTETSKASGSAHLALKLQLPLSEPAAARVQGTLQYGGNDVVLLASMPPIRNVSGALQFTEHGLTLNGVNGDFLGGPVTLAGGTQADGQVRITADGSVTAVGLQSAYPSEVLKRVSGASRYRVVVQLRDARPEITVESGLQGLALDFPAPLYKSAERELPFRFEMRNLPSADVAVQRDQLRLSLGSDIGAHYLRQRSVGAGAAAADWQVTAGGIGVQVPVPEPQGGLLANLSMDTLDLDAWRRIAASIDSGVSNGAGGSGFDARQYIEPQVLAARATVLKILGKKLDHVVVGASHQGRVWQANIDSEQASGYLTWAESESGSGLGRVTARLASLTIPESAGAEVGQLLEQEASTQIPGLDIVAEDFHLFGKPFGRLEVVANNVRGVQGREWQISQLAITNPDARFKGRGQWSHVDGADVSKLTYALDIQDAGHLLERFGFKDTLRGGKGRMDGEVRWHGLPFALDIPSLSGHVHLDLLAGQFLKAEPGVAKLLGVLSLQSLPRRLMLDFRDVFSQGFAFDGVVATAAIADGKLTTDSFKMRGVSATVLMDGSADLSRETQDLHVAVIPEINLGAASVLYGLAINPVVGLGSFLAQLFLRDPLMRAFTFEYAVTGPWSEPQVTRIDRRHQQPVAAGQNEPDGEPQ